MDNINWNDVADAIRKGRFEDIKPEIWTHIADNIEKKFVSITKGRPKEPAAPKWNNDLSPNQNEKEYFKYLGERDNRRLNNEKITPMDCYREIEERYCSLIEQGESAGRAKRQVAAEMTKMLGKSVSWQGIDRVLLAINAYEKSIREIEESETEDASKKLPAE